jgi:hypothetical protein
MIKQLIVGEIVIFGCETASGVVPKPAIVVRLCEDDNPTSALDLGVCASEYLHFKSVPFSPVLGIGAWTWRE